MTLAATDFPVGLFREASKWLGNFRKTYGRFHEGLHFAKNIFAFCKPRGQIDVWRQRLHNCCVSATRTIRVPTSPIVRNAGTLFAM